MREKRTEKILPRFWNVLQRVIRIVTILTPLSQLSEQFNTLRLLFNYLLFSLLFLQVQVEMPLVLEVVNEEPPQLNDSSTEHDGKASKEYASCSWKREERKGKLFVSLLNRLSLSTESAKKLGHDRVDESIDLRTAERLLTAYLEAGLITRCLIEKPYLIHFSRLSRRLLELLQQTRQAYCDTHPVHRKSQSHEAERFYDDESSFSDRMRLCVGLQRWSKLVNGVHYFGGQQMSSKTSTISLEVWEAYADRQVRCLGLLERIRTALIRHQTVGQVEEDTFSKTTTNSLNALSLASNYVNGELPPATSSMAVSNKTELREYRRWKAKQVILHTIETLSTVHGLSEELVWKQLEEGQNLLDLESFRPATLIDVPRLVQVIGQKNSKDPTTTCVYAFVRQRFDPFAHVNKVYLAYGTRSGAVDLAAFRRNISRKLHLETMEFDVHSPQLASPHFDNELHSTVLAAEIEGQTLLVDQARVYFERFVIENEAQPKPNELLVYYVLLLSLVEGSDCSRILMRCFQQMCCHSAGETVQELVSIFQAPALLTSLPLVQLMVNGSKELGSLETLETISETVQCLLERSVASTLYIDSGMKLSTLGCLLKQAGHRSASASVFMSKSLLLLVDSILQRTMRLELKQLPELVIDDLMTVVRLTAQFLHAAPCEHSFLDFHKLSCSLTQKLCKLSVDCASELVENRVLSYFSRLPSFYYSDEILVPIADAFLALIRNYRDRDSPCRYITEGPLTTLLCYGESVTAKLPALAKAIKDFLLVLVTEYPDDHLECVREGRLLGLLASKFRKCSEQQQLADQFQFLEVLLVLFQTRNNYDVLKLRRLLKQKVLEEIARALFRCSSTSSGSETPVALCSATSWFVRLLAQLLLFCNVSEHDVYFDADGELLQCEEFPGDLSYTDDEEGARISSSMEEGRRLLSEQVSLQVRALVEETGFQDLVLRCLGQLSSLPPKERMEVVYQAYKFYTVLFELYPPLCVTDFHDRVFQKVVSFISYQATNISDDTPQENLCRTSLFWLHYMVANELVDSKMIAETPRVLKETSESLELQEPTSQSQELQHMLSCITHMIHHRSSGSNTHSAGRD